MAGLFLIDDYLKTILVDDQGLIPSKLWQMLTSEQRTPTFLGATLRRLALDNDGSVRESREFPGYVSTHIRCIQQAGKDCNQPPAARIELLGAGKYEYRFFSADPVKILNVGGLFDLSTFDYKESQDDYLLLNIFVNIKVRKKSFQIKRRKTLENDMGLSSVQLFTDKEKISYPVSSGFLDHLFKRVDGQTCAADPSLLTNKKELLAYAAGVLGVAHDVVQKKRYRKKYSAHTKIEISQIMCHDRTWQSVCIESLSLMDVLGLSLFFDVPTGAFIGNYHEFLVHIREGN